MISSRTAANSTRSRTTPAGPACGNSRLANAAPNCTDAMLQTSSSCGGAALTTSSLSKRRSAERAAIGERGNTQAAPQLGAQRRAGAEPAAPRHLVDREVGRLQQQPGCLDPPADEPGTGGAARLVLEPAVERAHAHPGVRGEGGDVEPPVEVLERPG